MIASNGHAPKAFRRNAQPHIYVCSKGFRGAAPDKQRAVFAAAEIARKAKWVPLCPACPSYPEIVMADTPASCPTSRCGRGRFPQSQLSARRFLSDDTT